MNQDRKILYDHWQSIPGKKFLNIPDHLHPIRSTVLYILREGIMNDEPGYEGEVRHSLNALEIQELINKRIEKGKLKINKKGKISKSITKPISITNLYFHLNSLIDANLIITVASLKEGPQGKNKTNYYGRVARNLFVSDEEGSQKRYKRRFDEFKRLAKFIDFPLPENYEKLPIEYQKLKKHRNNLIADWIIKNENAITDSKSNLGEIYEFLTMVDALDPAYNMLLGDFLINIQKELNNQ